MGHFKPGEYYVQSTPTNSNLQGKSRKVRVIERLKQITGSKEIRKWIGRECNAIKQQSIRGI